MSTAAMELQDLERASDRIRSETTIGNAATTCLGSFETLLSDAERCLVSPPLTAQLLDNVARFRLWAGNVGAFHAATDKRSADARMAAVPEVVERLLQLLRELCETIEDLGMIVSEAKSDGSLSGLEDELLEPGSLSDAEGDANTEPHSEARELTLMIGDVITSLMKVSVLVRRATGRDRYVRAAAADSNALPPIFDIRHVSDKFPKVEKDPWLRDRLGKAITQRRQFLMYSQKHRQRLDVKPGFGSSVQYLSTWDTAPVEGMGGPSPASEEDKKLNRATTVSTRPSELSTKASTVQREKLRIDELHNQDLADFDDTISRTTSRISAGDEDVEVARIATLDTLSPKRQPFECPYCKGMVHFTRKSAWRTHAFSDLRAYVCTFEHCDAAMFERREAWFRHELDEHRRDWVCQSCPSAVFTTSQGLHKHLERRHSMVLVDTADSRLILNANSHPASEIDAFACPLCDDWYEKLKQEAAQKELPDDEQLVVSLGDFKQHLGRHQEQLAAFAISPNLEELRESGSTDLSRGSIFKQAEKVITDWTTDLKESDDRDLSLSPSPDDSDSSSYIESPSASVPEEDGGAIESNEENIFDQLVAYGHDSVEARRRYHETGVSPSPSEDMTKSHGRHDRPASRFGDAHLNHPDNRSIPEPGDGATPYDEERVEAELNSGVENTSRKENDVSLTLPDDVSLPRTLRFNEEDITVLEAPAIHSMSDSESDNDSVQSYERNPSPVHRPSSSQTSQSSDLPNRREGPTSDTSPSPDTYVPRANATRTSPLSSDSDEKSYSLVREDPVGGMIVGLHTKETETTEGIRKRSREQEETKPRGILKTPKEKFPDDLDFVREGVAPLKDATKAGIPPTARWTKIDRRLVNPEALEEANERFEERLDCVIVLRVLTKAEIQKLADRTMEIRKERVWDSDEEPDNAYTIYGSSNEAVENEPIKNWSDDNADDEPRGRYDRWREEMSQQIQQLPYTPTEDDPDYWDNEARETDPSSVPPGSALTEGNLDVLDSSARHSRNPQTSSTRAWDKIRELSRANDVDRDRRSEWISVPVARN